MQHKVKILFTEFVTHDVKRFIVEKPHDYTFEPGQATEVAINRSGWESEKRPFTFTSLNHDLVLEFTIKGYPEHNGMTKELHTLRSGDELIIDDPWGTINYKGPGLFIAGGAGITPFIAILRQLREEKKFAGNKLIFSNKMQKDIILEKEFNELFRGTGNLLLTLTEEKKPGYLNEKIDEDFLKRKISNFSQTFYICGPPQMVADMKIYLPKLGASVESVVFEK